MRKTFAFLLLLTLCSCALSAQKKPGTAQRNFDVREALQQKRISVSIEGTGGHQGACLKVICKNISGGALRIHFPQGQLMEPADSSQQTLVVAEEQWVAVSAKKPAELLLKTFCTQAGEVSPTQGSAFSVAALGPELLLNVLKFISDKGKTGSSAAQHAVWVVTNGYSLGSIGDTEITKFLADQLGKDMPGYRIKHKTVESVPGRVADLGKAMVVEGNMRFYLEKDEKVRMVLLDENGKFLINISKEETMIAGEHRSGLHLEVWNLTPGKYIVRMQTKDERVIKDMEVEFN